MSTCTINVWWGFFTILVARFEEKEYRYGMRISYQSRLLCIKGTETKKKGKLVRKNENEEGEWQGNEE